MNELVRITGKDMVAVALKPLKAGERVSCGDCEITLRDDLPMGHKAALRDIRAGEAVIKYGFPIGEATQDIPLQSAVTVQLPTETAVITPFGSTVATSGLSVMKLVLSTALRSLK